MDPSFHDATWRQMASCLDEAPAWIERRTEKLSFLDEFHSQREVTLLVKVPNGMPIVDGRIWLPISLVAKKGSLQYEVTDESGELLPRLTHETTRQFWIVQLSDGLRVLNDIVPTPSEDLLRAMEQLERAVTLVSGRSTESKDVVDTLEDLQKSAALIRASVSKDISSSAFVKFNKIYNEFLSLCHIAAERMPLVVGLIPTASPHRVLSFKYETPYELAPPHEKFAKLNVIGSALALAHWEARIPTPAIGLCESYHVTVIPPPNISIESSALLYWDKAGASAFECAHSPDPPHLHTRAANVYGPALTISGIQDDDGERRNSAWTPTVIVALRPSVRSWIYPWLAGAVASSLTILLARLFVLNGPTMDNGSLLANTDAWVALLLAAPSLLLIVLLRVSQHPLSSKLIRGSKAFAFGPFLLSFIVAWLFMSAIEPSHIAATLVPFLWLSMGFSVVPAIALLDRSISARNVAESLC